MHASIFEPHTGDLPALEQAQHAYQRLVGGMHVRGCRECHRVRLVSEPEPDPTTPNHYLTLSLTWLLPVLLMTAVTRYTSIVTGAGSPHPTKMKFLMTDTVGTDPRRPAPVDIVFHTYLSGIFAPQREEVDVVSSAKFPITFVTVTYATAPIRGSIRSGRSPFPSTVTA